MNRIKNHNAPTVAHRSRLIWVGLSSLLLLLLVGAGLFVANVGTTDAKDKPASKGQANQDLKKDLKLVSLDSPAKFKGTAPYPTVPMAGQRLLAITVDFDRDSQSHLRSSEAGEVYLTDAATGATYYTVDTGLPNSEGPGKKPVRTATFVFSVPSQVQSSALEFHYGALYSLPLPNKVK